MNDHGQQARASENFVGPVDFETPMPDLPVHFLNFQKPWLTRASESLKNILVNLAWVFQNLQAQQKFSLALACWPWSFISPDFDQTTF